MPGIPAGMMTSQTIVHCLTDDDPVPEPGTLVLFGIGLLSLAGINRKK